MKVFISWSGERSHAVAKALHDELTCLMNEVEPFISSEDIEKGTAWFPRISTELSNSEFGIICLTPENIESRWVHFEAGALACKFSNKKVAPLLIELEESQLRPPLSQLNYTRFKQDDVFKLMSAINCSLKKPLGEDSLKKSFERWWLPFEVKVNESLKKFRLVSAMKSVVRSDRDILEEVLDTVRSLQRGPSLAERLLSTTSTPLFLDAFANQKIAVTPPLLTNAWAEAMRAGADEPELDGGKPT